MELYWAGKDITRYVNILSCVHRDYSSGRADSVELVLDDAAAWYRWGPKEDDEVRVVSDGDDTGTMFLDTVIPDGDRFRIIATALRRDAARKCWKSYENTTIDALFGACAAECRMKAALWGVDGALAYRYILRQNEGAAAFLNRVGCMEGALVKAYGGAIRAVGLEAAQAMKPAAALKITTEQSGIRYERRMKSKLGVLTVKTPGAEVSARDGTAEEGNSEIVTRVPAGGPAEAGRWARGLLRMRNRQAEEISMETELNTAMTAMVRVDVTGETDMAGRWIVDSAEHDLIDKRTRTRLLRVTDSVE